MNVVYDSDFLEKLKKLGVRIRKSLREKILTFSKNPQDSQLDNHELRGEYAGHRSIDITGNYRAIYREVQIGDETVAYFVTIGTHEELYRKTKTH